MSCRTAIPMHRHGVAGSGSSGTRLRRRRRPPRRLFGRGMLLARPRRLHLEHQAPSRAATASPRCCSDTPASRAVELRPPRRGARPAAASRPGSPSRPRWRAASGHLRLKDGKGYTLLTTMTELKGHEERRGATRETGIVHGATTRPQHLARGDGARGEPRSAHRAALCASSSAAGRAASHSARG